MLVVYLIRLIIILATNWGLVINIYTELNYHKAMHPYTHTIIIIANRINGKLFLELKDGSIMSDLSLTYGFKRLVYGLLQKVWTCL
jgi:hypothetical protein